MAVLFMDGFEHYGVGDSSGEAMLDNVYASITSSVEVSAAEARTGDTSLRLAALNGRFIRRVFPAAVGEVFVGFAFFAQALPTNSERVSICDLRNAANDIMLSVVVLPTGAISVRNGELTSADVAVTAGPVLGAASWNHIEVRAVESTGVVQVRVNGEQVLDTSSFTFSASFAQWGNSGRGPGGGANTYYLDDLVVNDTTGSYNNTWKGDLRVATLFPDADATPSGWARYGRDKFGQYVLDVNEGCAYYADQAGYDIGTGDYTVEGFFRFYGFETSGPDTICGQYDTLNNQRSWRFFIDHDDAGALKLQISTDGQSGTVATIIRWTNYEFQLGRYYEIAISRVSGVTYLFINGQMQGVGVADTNDYHNSTSPLWLGAQLRGTGSSVLSGVDPKFTVDEFRFTVGTGRYAANYAPHTAAWPRSAPGDPDFADVQLLLGFENNINDESANGTAGQLSSSDTPIRVDTTSDQLGKYGVVDEKAPLDTTYIAADFIFATGTLTLTANAGNTETVTLGSTTYTFQTVLVDSANNVLIGADANETLENLAAAINEGSGKGTVYGTGTVLNTAAGAEAIGGNQLRATAAAQGTAGNSVASTETLAAGAWGDTTLDGGADIPAGQEFGFSPLPIDTTQVRAIQLYHRSRKTDSGACNLQASFHVGAASTDGVDRPVTTAFAYYADVFEEDPDTTAGLTVNSITAGQFQIDRTA